MVVEPLTYASAVLGGVLTVPAGFPTDFASIPRGLWNVLPPIGKYDAGAEIGYGGAYRCPEAMPVGVVAVGYADGFHRSLPTGTPARVRGKTVPMVGRVSMDMITIDLRAVPDAAVGDAVLLWGADLPVEQQAARAGTVAYELLCGLTQRVRFVHVG